MPSEGFTSFNHLPLDMILLHDANTSILSRFCLATSYYFIALYN